MKAVKSADYTYETIRQRIFDGSYAPGARLVEADVALEIKVSRAPVREALQRLAGTAWSSCSRTGGPGCTSGRRTICRRSMNSAAVSASRGGARRKSHNPGCLRPAGSALRADGGMSDRSAPGTRDRYAGFNTMFR